MIRLIYKFIYHVVSLLKYLVSTDLRLSVKYKNTNKETSQQLSDPPVAIRYAVVTRNAVLKDEQNFGYEGQRPNSAIEEISEGTLTIDPLLISTLHIIILSCSRTVQCKK